MIPGGASAAVAADAPPPSDAAPEPFESAARRAAGAVLAAPRDVPLRLAKRTSNLFRTRGGPYTGLDLGAFSGVYSVDPQRRRAVVGGLTTYEELVARTLPRGVAPLCVPQLRTITLGGAVTGLGIESASFRNGCPHESVVAMDILTGTGDVVRASPDGEHSDLYFGFPNSYGSLGYALRLEIELEPVGPFVHLQHIACGSVVEAASVLGTVSAARQWGGQRVDFVDATVFSSREVYVTVAWYSDEAGTASDYTGSEVYYQSIRRRTRDVLTTHDYLWRWDTDWFWCSRALGVQRPIMRRLWPASLRRSDVYWRLVAWDRRHRVSATADRLRRRPPREPVVQDVEVPLAALPEFMEFFAAEVGIAPVWLCPLRQRDPRAVWPLYAFDPDTLYVNVGFWAGVARTDGGDPADGRVNRAIEHAVSQLGGRKSLYSTSFYDRESFDRTYGGHTYRLLKDRYDPHGRFPEMYDKCVAGGAGR